MLAWLMVAAAAPLTDAISLYPLAYYTCAKRQQGPDVCWGGDYDRATPIHEVELPEPQRGPPSVIFPEQCLVVGQALLCEEGLVPWPTPILDGWSTCALGTDRRVRCVGRDWRWWFRMPPGTPTDQPVVVPGLDGADALLPHGCVLLDGALQCPDPATLGSESYLPERFVAASSRGCVQSDDQRVYCLSDTYWGVSAGVLDGDRPVRPELVRRANGTLDAPEAWVGPDLGDLALPPGALGREGVRVRSTVLAGGDHTCAIGAEGRVGCFGSDRFNQLGDGAGPRLPWTTSPAVRRVNVDPLDCSLHEGVVTCSSPDPWGSPTLPPRVLEDVEALHVGVGLGCADAGGHLRCFGRMAGMWILPDRAALHDVVDVAVGGRMIARTSDGRLHALDPSTGRFVAHDGGTDDTHLVAGLTVACAQNEADVWCHDDDGWVRGPSALTRLEVREGRICEQEQSRCVRQDEREEPAPGSVRWVEAP